jgi:PEP-CTERM motif
LYGAVIDTGGYNSFNAAFNTNRNSYTGGNMWLLSGFWTTSQSDNLLFQASFVASQPSSVPEPGAFLLMGAGLATLALLRGRHSSRNQAFSARWPRP